MESNRYGRRLKLYKISFRLSKKENICIILVIVSFLLLNLKFEAKMD